MTHFKFSSISVWHLGTCSQVLQVLRKEWCLTSLRPEHKVSLGEPGVNFRFVRCNSASPPTSWGSNSHCLAPVQQYPGSPRLASGQDRMKARQFMSWLTSYSMLMSCLSSINLKDEVGLPHAHLWHCTVLPLTYNAIWVAFVICYMRINIISRDFATIRRPFFVNFPSFWFNFNPWNVSIRSSFVGLIGWTFFGRPFLSVREANLIFRPTLARLCFSILWRWRE
jgi:hypothetical protein